MSFVIVYRYIFFVLLFFEIFCYLYWVFIFILGDLYFLNFNRFYESYDLSCGIWNEKLKIFIKGLFYMVEINGNKIIVNNIDL